MTHTISDQEARQQALDPKRSFIVQAPAGSGKTALLIARMLSLLAQCQQPEQVLAITFTRKAAIEMRERMLNTLKNADTQTTHSPHQAQLQHLAQAVQQKDVQLGWGLLKNPNRLRIQTIDSFCAQITHQLPITSEMGSPPAMALQPHEDYEAAIDAFLNHTDTTSTSYAPFCALLTHLNGQLLTAKRLLSSLLACRDQWLPYLIQSTDPTESPTQLHDILQNNLQHFIDQQQQLAHELLPDHWHTSLPSLIAYAQSNGLPTQPTPIATGSLAYWQTLCTCLLTHQLKWRKSVTQKQGFPAASSCSTSDEKKQAKAMKDQMKDLLSEAPHHRDLLAQLQLIHHIPTTGYSEHEQHMIHTLSALLPLLAAHLSLHFKQKGQADFTEINIKALQALSHSDQPSELALALDRRIEHILIDEFQDTSMTQYRLLEQLTLGWQPNDGRTLFAVGDPMQSIYRFRQAEVGLFEKLKQQGMHHIQPTPLTLQSNFRSDPQIVSWINHHAASFFPSHTQSHLGAVAFTPANAQHAPATHAEAQCHLCEPGNAQQHAIIALIQQERKARPQSHIAILVRSRSHLIDLLPALAEAAIPYQAVDIDRLADHPVVLDLISLTRAIHHLADRTAWLAILRAPWCGLTLADMLILSEQHIHRSLWQQMQDPATLAQLTPQGRKRLAHLVNALHKVLHPSAMQSLRDKVENTWHALQAAHAYPVPPVTVRSMAQSYLDHLETSILHTGHYDSTHHTAALEALYAPPTTHHPHAVSIMTIHKAKGLEFDCIILPNCQKTGAQDAQQLLIWQQNPMAQAHASLMLAPLPAKNSERSCYHLLKHLEKQKQHHELKRLLYVALTRAKYQIHCLASIPMPEENPSTEDACFTEMPQAPKNSLMALLQPAFAKALCHRNTQPHHVQPSEKRPLYRLPLEALDHHDISPAEPSHTQAPLTEQAEPNHFIPITIQSSAIIGTVIHHILCQLARRSSAAQPLPHATDAWLTSQQAYWHSLLIHHQCDPSEYTKALAMIQHAVQNTLSDNRGRWLLTPHAQAQSEVAMQLASMGGTKTHVIDRTFVIDQTRWIIDFKCTDTALHHNTPLSQWFSQQRNRYQAQLENYASVYQARETLPIQLALYFPLMADVSQRWCTWIYQAQNEACA